MSICMQGIKAGFKYITIATLYQIWPAELVISIPISSYIYIRQSKYFLQNIWMQFQFSIHKDLIAFSNLTKPENSQNSLLQRNVVKVSLLSYSWVKNWKILCKINPKFNIESFTFLIIPPPLPFSLWRHKLEIAKLTP